MKNCACNEKQADPNFKMMMLEEEQGLRLLNALVNGGCPATALREILGGGEENDVEMFNESDVSESEAGNKSIIALWYEANAKYLRDDMRKKRNELRDIDSNNRTYLEDLGYLRNHVKEQLQRATDETWVDVLEEIDSILNRTTEDVRISKESNVKIHKIMKQNNHLMGLLDKEAFELNTIYNDLSEGDKAAFLKSRKLLNDEFKVSTGFARKLLSALDE